MTEEKILDALTDIDGRFIREARAEQKSKGHLTSRRFTILIAAVIALMAVTVTAFASEAITGWFRQYFGAKKEADLTPGQVEYIEDNEQVIAEAKEENGWTVELKSAITDGDTGYILFGVTAPEDIDLEAALGQTIFDEWFITPGCFSFNNHLERRRTLIVPSTGPSSEELNYFWQDQSYWEADNDGASNTLNYMIEIRCEKMYPERECLLEAPFGSDVTFNVRFIDFTYEYKDPEIQKALDEKYAGQDEYFIGGEEMKGLRKSDILVEGVWEFDINFGMDTVESIELISEPITVEAKVYRKIENGTMFYDTTHALEQVKLTSFRLTSFGAQLMFEEDEDMIGEFIEYQNDSDYEDRYIYVVMKDGSQIALHTDGIGTELTADSPVVLEEVDHILLADGTKIPMP